MTRHRIAIVGAGTAGCVLAGRLSAIEDLDVFLIEEGPAPDPATIVAPPRPIWSLEGASDPSTSRRWSCADGSDDSSPLITGRGVGGSGRINGGYFMRPTTADLVAWSRVLGDAGWGDELVAAMIRSETDHDHPTSPLHGHDGPVPVHRDTSPLHPVSTAFAEAVESIGLDEHPDMNDGGSPGFGPVPFNARAGQLADTALTHLAPALGRPNLTVLTGQRVERLVIRGSRIVGVVVTGPTNGASARTVEVDEVILCAGTFGTPAILFSSGIGDPDALLRHSITPLLDNPVVGRAFRNHPVVDLTYVPRPGISTAARPAESFMQLVAHTTVDGVGGVDAEFMATRRPYGVVTGTNPTDGTLSLRVTLLDATPVGRIEPTAAGATVFTDGGHREHDHRTMDRAVAFAIALLSSDAFEEIIDYSAGPPIRSRSTAFHMTGSCPMGIDPAISVVDRSFRVHGIEGLRIVDASVVPVRLSRGPSACIVGLAELASMEIGRATR